MVVCRQFVKFVEVLAMGKSVAIHNELLQPCQLLIADDDEDVRKIYHRKLSGHGYLIDEADSISELRTLVSKKSYDAVLLDNFLGDGLGVDVITDIVNAHPNIKIMMLTSDSAIDSVVTAMNCGAVDFLPKCESVSENIAKINRIMARNEVFYPDSNPNGIIGTSTAIKKVLRSVAKVSASDITVLLGGESGTGKELVARAIHESSPRFTTGPFIAINCGAITESLLEAELFGSKKGSYTGSLKDRRGYFEVCSEGTLFLDEVGEMPLAIQVKLLRVLQEREITPIGSVQPLRVNTRIIAATNRNIEEEVKSGRFREDLYYRLCVVRIDLPTLRERLDDLSILVHHFVARANARYGKSVNQPPQNLIARLKGYSWPGNVRELNNSIERAVLLAEGNDLSIEDILPTRNKSAPKVADCQVQNTFAVNFQEAKDAFEKAYLNFILEKTRGNIAEAAWLSGVFRAAIYRLLKKHHVDPDKFR